MISPLSKQKLRLCTFLFAATTIILGLTYVTYSRPTNFFTTVMKSSDYEVNKNLTTFNPLNSNGISSFRNVCIEPIQEPVKRSFKYIDKFLHYNETQRIVVYNYIGDKSGKQRISVAGSSNTEWNYWDVDFRSGPIPDSHTYQENTAFFVVPTCPVNLHHFWQDEFVGLYSVVKSTNRLLSGERLKNQILYRQPYHLLKDVGHLCWNYLRYEGILGTLHIESFHGVFYNIKPNTCFSSAVFGTAAVGLTNNREVTGHVLKELGVKQDQPDRGRFTTFIQRTNRRILNVEELSEAARKAGIPNVRIIQFENLSLRSQAELALTSRVMIGVQGAGLQWAIFMPPNSTLIEIAWPKKYWNFYYSSFIPQYQLRYVDLEVEPHNVYANWTTYERLVRLGKVVPEAERNQMLNQPLKDAFDNLWKHADVIVNKDILVKKLLSVA